MDELYSLLPGKAEFDANRFSLGPLCKRGHRWKGSEFSLRYSKGRSCVECAKQKSRDQAARGLHAAANQRRRIAHGRPARGKQSTGELLPVFPGLKGSHAVKAQQLVRQGHTPDEARVLALQLGDVWNAIEAIKPAVTVAELVRQEQRRYWDENPKAEKDAKREANRRRAKWRSLTDHDYRLYHRQKSKRRKAQMRNSVALQVSAKQIRARFAQFDHRCAYCGAIGEDLHIEHVVPISKGGPHALGNIIPACQQCNFSKAASNAELWFRAQTFFSETRWRKIRRVLGWDKASDGQLALL